MHTPSSNKINEIADNIYSHYKRSVNDNDNINEQTTNSIIKSPSSAQKPKIKQSEHFKPLFISHHEPMQYAIYLKENNKMISLYKSKSSSIEK